MLSDNDATLGNNAMPLVDNIKLCDLSENNPMLNDEATLGNNV